VVFQNITPTSSTEIYDTEYDRNAKEFEKPESQIGMRYKNLDKINTIAINLNDYENHKVENRDSDDEEDEDALDEIEDENLRMPKPPIRFIIIDCSPINFVDTLAVKAIKEVKNLNFI
jgi:hypothetical protein